jgi:hypothetical protein
VQISEPAASSVSRRIYKILLKSESGAPVAGEDVVLTLEGGGSFAPSFHADEIRRETDAAGEAMATWYRRSIYLRDVKATVTATATKPDRTVSLELYEGPTNEVRMSWKPDEIRIPPRRT